MLSSPLHGFRSMLIATALLTLIVPTHAQNPTITLTGHVFYSTGEPAGGAAVTLIKTIYVINPNDVSYDHTPAGSDGSFSFQVEARCGVSYDVQATSSEIVDDEPLPPSGVNSYSGCVLGDVNLGTLTIPRPQPITLGGHVTDQGSVPVQGLTVTMTRTKYNLDPHVVTTATTTTDGSGHYQFSTYSRCSVEEVFTASIGNYVFPGGTSISGCVTGSVDTLNFSITLGALEDAGETSCNKSVGRPVNITNGNVYLQQADFQLPSAGYGILISRSYNSISSNIGLFGRGWTTAYDESVATNSSNQMQLTMPDGRLISFATPDFFGQIVKHLDNSYTVTFKDGRVHRFSVSGKLLSMSDRNGNQTNLGYDSNGSLVSIADAFGRMLTITSDVSGKVLSISDSMGTIATYNYSGNNLQSVTYADNSGFQFSYDGNSRLTSLSDALGNIIESHVYDVRGRAISSETQGGVERYTLNYVNPTETDVTDALGRVTKFFFHRIWGRNVVTQVEGSCSCGNSQVQRWTYDEQLNITSHTNALGQVATYTYDANGNELSGTGVLGTATFTYNQLSEMLTATDAMGGVTTNTYDVAGNVLSVKDALNDTTAFTYDGRGELLTLTNALGKVTTLEYDGSGNVSQATDALSGVTKFAYDARRRMTGATGALNHVMTYGYDAAGRLNKFTRPDSSFVTVSYDLAGRRTKITDALNNSTSFAYDGAYRLLTITDALGNSVSYAYDLVSNLTSATDQLGHTTNYAYDDFNRPTTTIYPPAVTGATRLQESIAYDAVGNVTQRTDTAGRVTNFAYDNANRLTSVTDPLLQLTSYEYNARSNLTALVDPLDQHYTFGYDALGRVTTTTSAGRAMSFAYDAAGNPIQRTGYNNVTTDYVYDALNRLTTISYPDASAVSYSYDKLSRLTAATNINGTVSFVYDNMGRMTNTTDVWGQVISYGYDANSNRTQMSFGATPSATYAYDALNRLTTITDDSRQTVNYGYDAASKLDSRNLPNGVDTNYAYDGLDRLTGITAVKGKKVVAGNSYQFNSAGDIIQNLDQGGAHVYGYDALDRLTAASYPAMANESYAYDAVGNRTSSQRSATYSYQPFNRLTATSTASYVYDNNGNLTAKTEGMGTTQFAWDFENRLTQVSTPSSGSVTYKYDALGRRIQRAPSVGASTNFIYDGQDVVQDVNSDATTVDYLNGPGLDNKISQTSTSGRKATTLYYLADHLGSTTALTNKQGHLLEQISYDSYGDSTGSVNTRYDYTGRERDPLTGLMFYRARWYDSQIGRFISEDPIGLGGGINQFAYVGNSPQNATDPSGLYEIDVHLYLTYFLALKTGCFTDAEARLIAIGDQNTDINHETAPALGVLNFPGSTPDYPQQQRNMDYHALHPGSHQPYLQRLWTKAIEGDMRTLQGELNNLNGLSVYLHYSQDTFSHEEYSNPSWGHGLATHYPDKTASDVPKAMRMAGATWNALNDFAEKKCGCRGKFDPSWWGQVRQFAEASGGPFYREISEDELNNKLRILNVAHF